MSKLIYVYGDDSALLDTLVSALRAGGYSLEYTTLNEETPVGTVTADIALVCRTAAPGSRLTAGGVTVDADALSVTDEAGGSRHFAPTEFALLTYLLKHADRAVSRGELLTEVWGIREDSATRVADDTVKRLRKKLSDTRLNIETVWGFGFKVTEKEK